MVGSKQNINLPHGKSWRPVARPFHPSAQHSRQTEYDREFLASDNELTSLKVYFDRLGCTISPGDQLTSLQGLECRLDAAASPHSIFDPKMPLKYLYSTNL